MLPRVDGLEVCRRVRAVSTVPIIMLTARDDEVDKVLGLEIGADDYITKPFSIREFSSRVRALLRRAQLSDRPERSETIERDEPADRSTRRAGRGARGAACSSRTSSSSSCARSRRIPGRVYSRQQLLEALWGSADYRDPRTIDVHIRHLREKIERDPSEPEYIFTVRGVGYRFRDR